MSNVLEVIDREMVRRAADRVTFAEANSENMVPLCRNVLDNCTAARTAVSNLIDAAKGIPDDVDMIEHNPDEGTSYFCCGASVAFHPPKRNHAEGCWYVRLCGAVARVGKA